MPNGWKFGANGQAIALCPLAKTASPRQSRAMKKDPIRTTDQEARELAQRLIRDMKHAVLGTLDPDSGTPLLTRIAIQTDRDGCPMALLSGLAAHSRAIKADPKAGLMIADDTVAKGDPMTHARLSILARAVPAEPDPERRARWLANDPKATVYIDLPDFTFWRLEPQSALLNAGFARAYRLEPQDMLTAPAE